MSPTALVQQTEHKEQLPNHCELDLLSSIEALLFIADEPVSIHELTQALETNESQVEAALQQLAVHYRQRGLRLQRNNCLVQFVTAPEAAPCIKRFLGLDSSSRLSTAALETLALIAYQQPITRVQIEAIRGVSCDGVLRTLLSHGLVAPVGRLEQVGRPILYGTTFEFLQYFGLADLSELPALEELLSPVGGKNWHAARRAADATPTDEKV